MPDATSLRGTATSRRTMLARGAGLVAGGLAALVIGVLGLLVGAVSIILVLGGLVAVFSGAQRLLWALRRHPVDLLPWLCGAWVLLIVAAAALAPLLPLAEGRNATAALSEPTYLEALRYGDHPLGTNSAGLDLLSRAIFGARTSLSISLVALTIGLVVGGMVGVVAGYYRKATDRVIGIFTNSLLAVPPLILLIALATLFTPSPRNLAFALSLLTIPAMIRLARANTILFAQREFVLAARALGASRARVMLRELVPNVALPLLSMAVVMISALIVAEASLSFLGLGIAQPEPTWGNMISEAQAGDTLQEHPGIVIVPGMFLFLTVFSFNLLGEKVQRLWDPRSGQL